MKVRSMGLTLVFMFSAAIAVQACRGAPEPTSRVAETEGDETISEAKFNNLFLHSPSEESIEVQGICNQDSTEKISECVLEDGYNIYRIDIKTWGECIANGKKLLLGSNQVFAEGSEGFFCSMSNEAG